MSALPAAPPSGSEPRIDGPRTAWPAAQSPAAASTAIELQNVVKTYGRGAVELRLLDGITFKAAEGEFLALTGPSGSGKTTLLNLVAGIDRPSSGRLVVAGTELGRLSESELARWRSRNVGVIFQSDTLIPFLSALENVELPLRPTPLSGKERRAHARNALELVGLGARAGHHPRQLCGDETQRLAIARAIVADPRVLVADEPTRHLDACNADQVLTLLQRLNGELGKTLLVATRDPEVALRANARYRLHEGVLCEPKS